MQRVFTTLGRRVQPYTELETVRLIRNWKVLCRTMYVSTMPYLPSFLKVMISDLLSV